MNVRETVKTAKDAGGKAGQRLADGIVRHIGESLVPGDAALPPEWIDEAAAALLEAAGTRAEGEAVVRIVSHPEQRRMGVAIINDDMPFLVDSVAAAIVAEGLAIEHLIHPVIAVERDARGALARLPEESVEGVRQESMIYVETDRADALQRRNLERSLVATLADVRAAVGDWKKLVAAMTADADRLQDDEGAELLRWLSEGMLTQLGHLTRRRDGSHSQLLGICRRGAKTILADASFDRAFKAFDTMIEAGAMRAPIIVKANRISRVHRRVPIDLFIVPVIEDGKLAALSVHAGLWTSEALAMPPHRVPRLRQQMARLSQKLGFDPGGHTGKALAHALTSLPHDLIISFEDNEVERLATTMTSLVDRPRPRLRLVEAPLARHLLAFVWLPRDLISTQMRRRIQQTIEDAVGAETIDWSLQVEAGALAVLRYVLDIREGSLPLNEHALDQKVQVMLRGWREAVEAALSAAGEPMRAPAIATRYAEAFPLGYRSEYGADEAALDIGVIRRLSAPDGVSAGIMRDVRLFRHDKDEPGRLRLKIYQREGVMPLSDAVPALENFGFRVLTEIPTPLEGGRLATIHDFTLGLPDNLEAHVVLERGPLIERAICSVLNGRAENDTFNRLVTALGVSERECDWLRAFYRYLRQTGMTYTIYTVVDALRNASEVTLGLIGLFRARHDPGYEGNRGAAQSACESAVREGLAAVTAINDDRVLRLYHALATALLRTNAFAPAADEALAFKFDSGKVPGLPKPVPWREIFVYSRRLEGIHLRAGPVARGGLRWSDRRDDFRTEILGLMKAQRVKNAVIVPTGAKGGFYPKRLPDPQRDRAAWAAEGQGAYEVFIRTLLSVTDNIVDGKVVHPEGVTVLDGEDPYFVVAADKGTAKFSDVANGIAQSEDFWLDDAFASGGSNGYDHKAMGITARGAWLSVQRHFLEMGIDVQSEPVSVIGCGDMSGDVFGNGMLLSKAIRLVAAFDHRHIFIDPDPDAAAGWAERTRLFELLHSSWDDYDKSLISKGGGVFPRSMKSIPLTDEIRGALGIEATELDPDSLISAILASPNDLLWFGGIGTYVKAEAENNAAVGDPANDMLRVNAEALRCKVVGEGANLGITQAARIAFARNGGRINTDFIDNSAGVDCSDNEVNIKIALAAARRAGKLSEKRRTALLAEMTDEVADLVLEDNRLQALALSIAEIGGAQAIPSMVRLIETLEGTGALDRRTEGLADSEQLSRRSLDGAGMTRPELAVVLSSCKLVLQDAIENSDLPDDPDLVELLFASFPEPMRAKYGRFIKEHRLRREIIATKLANRIVNRLGVVAPFELAEEEGADLAQVAAAFVVADRLFDLTPLWEGLERSPMPEPARILLFDKLAHAVRNHMADLLRVGAGRTAPSVLYHRLTEGCGELGHETKALLGEGARTHSARISEELMQAGATAEAAGAVAHLFDLDGAVGLSDLAAGAKISARKLVAAFTRLGSGLGLDWAQTTAAVMSPSDPWERLLVAGLARDFQQMRLEFLKGLTGTKLGRQDPTAAVETWGQSHQSAIASFRAMVARAEASAKIGPAMLAQIASQARNLLAR
jgi:glutamate dehydrogenase